MRLLGNENKVQENLSEVEYEKRLALINTKGLTLNGKKARIGGARLRFAMVSELGSTCGGHEWAWSTVEHIIKNRKGKFEA